MKSMFLIERSNAQEVMDICERIAIKVKSMVPEEIEKNEVLYRVVTTNLTEELAKNLVDECSKLKIALFLKSIKN